jgi:predicted kinase
MLDHKAIARFHIICGATGAGKSTYAKALADEIGGIHFAIDEWMVALFWKDSPDPIEFEWAIERVNRCEVQIAAMATQCIKRGVPAILDLGFTKAARRQKFANIASKAGIELALHYLDLPADARWARVQQRNAQKGETFSLEVGRDMFEFVEGMWEAPDDLELHKLNGRRVSSEN